MAPVCIGAITAKNDELTLSPDSDVPVGKTQGNVIDMQS